MTVLVTTGVGGGVVIAGILSGAIGAGAGGELALQPKSPKTNVINESGLFSKGMRIAPGITRQLWLRRKPGRAVFVILM
jgi:hypothetical protein